MDHMDHMDHMDNMDHSETMDQMEPSHTMAHSMGHMMMMYFHGGYDEVILFDFWRVSTIGGLVGSMIGCFLMGVLYEGIKSYREHWMNGAFHAVSYNQMNSQRKSPSNEQTESGGTSRGDNVSDQGSIKVIETKMFSIPHIVLTILHMVQMTLAYFLMLIVMTYNSWLCAAVIFGSTLGYFLFGWRKTTIVDVSDHCH